MIDLTQLAQAQEVVVDYTVPIEPSVDAKVIVLAAVDAVLQADQIKWCQTHATRKAYIGGDWCMRKLAYNEDEGGLTTECEFVSVVVVPVETP